MSNLLITLTPLLIFACGVADRWRGDDDLGFGGKTLCALGYGVLVGALAFGVDWRMTLLYAPGHALAIAIAYGGPWGTVCSHRDATEKFYKGWQYGPFKTNAYLALAFRGLVGALCVLPVCYYAGYYRPMPGIFLGFTLAPLVSRYLLRHELLPDWFLDRFNFRRKLNWNVAEFFRGITIGVVVIILAMLTG